MQETSFGSLLYRYFFFAWLFKDASRGNLFERSAAWRHNREQARWLPTYMRRWFWCGAVLYGLGGVVEWLLQALPAVSGMLSVAAWLVWGLVAMLLLVLGAALHALIVWWRRSGQGAVATAARRAAGLRPSA